MALNGGYAVSCRLEAWRGGVFFKPLRAWEIEIRMSSSAEIKTSLCCCIDYDPDLDLLNDRLRPVQVVNGTEYPLGEFIISTAAETQGRSGRYWKAEAYDQTLLLKQAATTGTLRFAAGTNYLDAVKSLLSECGIAWVFAEPNDAAMTADREDWEIGTSYLSIANELLAAINFGGVWFDRSGAARLARRRAAVAANITQSYPAGRYSILCDGISREADAFTAYNVFTAVYSSPDAAPMAATAVNDSLLSPISTVRRGRRICAPAEFVDDIADQEALQAFADQLLSDSLLAGETIEFETAPVPTHEIGEVVALAGNLYLETEWSLKLGFGGSFIHKARRSAAI